MKTGCWGLGSQGGGGCGADPQSTCRGQVGEVRSKCTRRHLGIARFAASVFADGCRELLPASGPQFPYLEDDRLDETVHLLQVPFILKRDQEDSVHIPPGTPASFSLLPTSQWVPSFLQLGRAQGIG